MTSTALAKTSSARIRAQLDHPIVDVDGHHQEFTNLLRERILEYGRQAGGPALVDRIRKTRLTYDEARGVSSPERSAVRRDTAGACPAWWALPGNTRDRATAHLPALLNERLDEVGIDFSVLYPSMGLGLGGIEDDQVRQVACRAYNAMNAELFAPYAERMTPVAVIPMHTPEEALEELDHAIVQLGLKTIVVGYVRRPLPKVAREAPDVATLVQRLDTLGIDSDYDYDPFWRRCEELKLAVGVHASGQGWGSRRSPSRYVYNHIGAFAAANEALAKSIFLGGVTRRFPGLNFAFLEGGAGWACALYADLVGHWQKRGGHAIRALDPANIDVTEMVSLIERYGPVAYTAHIDKLREFMEQPEFEPDELDDWGACGIDRVEDVKELFVDRFYIGCEADDPLNAWAFDTDVNPLGARLNAVFGSDLGHWDVTDLTEIVEEAYELVQDGVITDTDFRDFVFANPVDLYTRANPDFFVGTRCEAAAANLAAERRAGAQSGVAR